MGLWEGLRGCAVFTLDNSFFSSSPASLWPVSVDSDLSHPLLVPLGSPDGWDTDFEWEQMAVLGIFRTCQFPRRVRSISFRPFLETWYLAEIYSDGRHGEA